MPSPATIKHLFERRVPVRSEPMPRSRVLNPDPRTRSAVVTGGARGIGRAIVSRLVAEGYAVVISDFDAEAAKRTAGEVGAVEAIGQDVTDEVSHVEVAQAAQAHRPLGLWVNNAGVGHDGTVADMDSAGVRALVDVNLLGVVWGSRAAVAAFREQAAGGIRGGDLLALVSLSAHGPVPGLSVYAATKAAVLSLTESMYAELAPEGIRVHGLCPDGADTDLVAGMTPGGRGSALLHSGGRLLTVDEVAAAAVGMVGSSRVVRTVPAWRGAVMRISRDWPSVAMRLEPAFRRQGARMARRQGHGPSA